MDLLQTFVFNASKHEVRIIRNDDDEPLFHAPDVGKVLEMKNIRKSIEDFDEDERVSHTMGTAFGEKDVTFLTEQGMYKLLMRSRKPIAKPFQKWVFKVIKDIQKTGRYEMQTKIDDMQKKCDAEVREAKDSVDEIAHKAALVGSDKRHLVYYGKIKTMEDGTFLVKIGSTSDIKKRLIGLVAEFGQMAIIHTFECDRHVAFERELLERSDIRKYRYKEVVNGLKKSTEVFRVNSIELQRLVNIGTRNVSKYRDTSNKRDLDDVIDTNPTMKRVCMTLGIEPQEVPSGESRRGHATTTIGRKVQKYSPDTEVLLETFNQVLDVIRFKQHSEFSVSGVSRACEDRTVYKGFRWAYLDRDLDDSTVQDIGETVVKTELRKGHVATLSPDRTRVDNVYRHFKELGISMGYTGPDAVIKRMKKGHPLSDGRHIVPWMEVPENVRNEWLETNELPDLQPNHVCKSVNQLDKDTGDVVKTFATMNAVKISFAVTGRTIHRAISGGTELRGFKWAYASA